MITRGTLASCLCLLAATQVAHGQSPARAKVTVFLVPAKGFKAQTLAKVTRAMSKALRQNPNLDMEDSDKLLVQYAGEVPRNEIAEAKRMRKEGVKLLKDGDAAGAVQSLEIAFTAYEQVLAFVKKVEVAKALMALAVAQAEAGMKKQARASFIRLLTWRPHLRYDTDTFSPRHLPLFEKARAVVKRNARGSVELSTTPPGAKAYVDGRFMGVTPTVAFGLKVGEHYATFKKPGFVKAAQKIEVSPTAQRKFTQELKRSEKFLLLKQSLAAAREGLGRAKANAGMNDLRSFLYIDQAVFVTVGYGGPSHLTLQGFLYDLRSKLRLNQATLTVNAETLDGVDRLAQMLYMNVRYDGNLEAPPEPPPPPPEKRTPFYASWWFWTAVGAGVAAAVVLPITLWPDSNTCGGPCVTVQN